MSYFLEGGFIFQQGGGGGFVFRLGGGASFLRGGGGCPMRGYGF